MLQVLGYDPSANPPDYGKPDSFVINKMKEIERNREQWLQKEREMLRERESIRATLLKQRDNRVKDGEEPTNNDTHGGGNGNDVNDDKRDS